MGYIGLLLNAPYKIDSMVWMWMWIRFYIVFDVRRVAPHEGLREPNVKIGHSGGFRGIGGFLGITLVLGLFRV
jgi:hypothetical protein